MAKSVAFFNKKGGTAKTSISFNIAKDLDYYLLSNDDSTIEEIYPKMAKIMDEIEFIEDIESIYDLGGFIDNSAIEVFKNVDYIFIPMLLDVNSLKRTINTFIELSEYNDNLAIIISRVKPNDEKKFKQFYEKLEMLECPIFEIRESEAFRNSTLTSETITEQFNKNAFNQRSMKNVYNEYSKLKQFIKEI